MRNRNRVERQVWNVPVCLLLLVVFGGTAGCVRESGNRSTEQNESTGASDVGRTDGASASVGHGDATKKWIMVCSTTQCADFARQIVGDRWIVHCVLGPGQDPHGYEPRVSDSNLVSQADLCVHNGWNLEGHGWMQRLAEAAGKPLVTCVAEVEPLLTDADQPVNDPHAWFDPANAWKYTKQILEGVVRVDPANEWEYRARALLYRDQLRTLEKWVERQVATISEPRVLVTHHDAFGYFCRRFGFRAASPVGWTTDEIAGTTIADRQAVVEQIRSLRVKSIFVETSLNHEMIEAIAKEAGAQIGGELYSDAMGPAGSAGETYIGMMRENTMTIVKGLR